LRSIPFVPDAGEIVELAVHHLSKAPQPIVSFGTCCEGEPLLQADLLRDVIIQIRKKTKRGTIHVNTNGTLPEVICRLRESGLDSLRVDFNSVRRDYFNRYARINWGPILKKIKEAEQRYFNNSGEEENVDKDREEFEPEDCFDKAKDSLKLMKEKGGFTSIRYMILPGLNDEWQEMEELCAFIEETRIDMIQWRNIAIDPEYYLESIRYEAPASLVYAKKMGVKGLIQAIRDKYPHLRHAYYNPCLDEKSLGYNLFE